MAESYLLNIKPTISASDGRKMEKDLNNRFMRVAKKFGGALKTVGSKLKGIIAGGAVAGITAIATNPIDALNQSMDETLQRYDDLASRAKQLGVSSGQLFQATAIAKSAGIEEEDFRSILTAYAVKLGEAQKGDDPMLHEFLGEENIINSFFQFMKSLQALQPKERMYYASKIIGEDDASKLAELIETDFMKRKEEIFGNGNVDINKAINKLADVEGTQSIFRSKNNLTDLVAKSNLITNETVRMQSELERRKQNLENTQLSTYEAFIRMQTAMEESKNILADIQTQLAPALEKLVELLEKIYKWVQTKLTGWGVFK